MNYIEAREKLREAKRDALANSCNIKVGRRELEVALDALSKPDMREKVKEYIAELDAEIDRLNKILEDMITKPEKETVDQRQKDKINIEIIKSRAHTLMDVKCDLESRLEELA